MQVYKQHALLNATLRKIKLNSVGLVPTMGALHQGHLALVKKATEENQKVIVTIFINPTQFNNLEDLANYPSTLETDLIALTPLKEKILLYVPEVSDLYQSSPKPEHYHFGALESYMEGEARPGHFQGVATIVHKLFTLFQPTRAYFGEKDYQQLRIIHALVKLHKPYVEVIDCPIVRHDDGLAMSSRNQRLSAKERRQAPLVFETLSKAAKMKHQSQKTVRSTTPNTI